MLLRTKIEIFCPERVNIYAQVQYSEQSTWQVLKNDSHTTVSYLSEIEFLTGWYITYIMFLCSSLRQLDLRTAGTKLKVVSTVILRSSTISEVVYTTKLRVAQNRNCTDA